MPQWGTGRFGEERWGEGGPLVEPQIAIEVAVAAPVLLIEELAGVAPLIEIAASCPAPVFYIEELAGVAPSIAVAAACAVLGEVTLPPPKTMRVNAWLRPAL